MKLKDLPNYIIGIVIGIGIQMTFNFPKTYWFSRGLGVGTLVNHSDEAGKSFYNECKYGQVLYIKDLNNILVEWKHCENHYLKELQNGFLDIHNLQSLRRYNEN